MEGSSHEQQRLGNALSGGGEGLGDKPGFWA